VQHLSEAAETIVFEFPQATSRVLAVTP